MRARNLALVTLLACLAACESRPAPTGGSTPERIVTLAPHLAELLVAAGAGDRLVGVSAYTDFPPAVAELPVVGDAFMIDREQLALLDADLLLAWESGTPAHTVDELRALGHRVEVIRTRSLADVAAALRRLGELTGSVAAADEAAERYEAGLSALRRKWRDAAPIRVFYQVDRRPVFTVNGAHYVSELISVCGGENVFADLSDLAPMVSEEAVVNRDPEVLLAAGDAGSDALEQWRRWPGLAANRYDNHFLVPADAIGRATPRLLSAASAVCEKLQSGREQRAGSDG